MINAKELGYEPGEAVVYENQRYLDAAPQIKAANQRALGTADILTKRLHELEVFAEKYGDVGSGKKWDKKTFEKECPWNKLYMDTSTAASATSDLIIIQHDSPQLAAVTPATEVYDGGLKTDGPLSGGRIRIYSGEILKQLRKDKLINTKLTEAQVSNYDGEGNVHPIWDGYADDNKELIQKLAPLTFKALRDVYNRKDGMGTHFSEDGNLRAAFLNGAGVWADADARVSWGPLVVDDVRLVGVVQREEAPEGGAPLEERVGKA